MTFVQMYMNILKKYGADSPQMKKYKKYYHIYQNKKHIVVKIYKIIMNEQADR